ncbi:hypothetical protein CCHR01_18323 [Colletotrichum chrysophilum]|uniref:Uncharacterized protein n=1 Tax=Colletotrichum chrysophilum TaxID=1836956 RepID=A0AAD9A0K3_9PEZI|nr:hypothetical protein CCHR01_18323 [Colletotrichum chrysophilum]
MAATAKWDQQFSTATVLVFMEANGLRPFKIANPIKPRQICVRVCRILKETSHFHRFSRPSSAPLPGTQTHFLCRPGRWLSPVTLADCESAIDGPKSYKANAFSQHDNRLPYGFCLPRLSSS